VFPWISDSTRGVLPNDGAGTGVGVYVAKTFGSCGRGFEYTLMSKGFTGCETGASGNGAVVGCDCGVCVCCAGKSVVVAIKNPAIAARAFGLSSISSLSDRLTYRSDETGVLSSTENLMTQGLPHSGTVLRSEKFRAVHGRSAAQPFKSACFRGTKKYNCLAAHSQALLLL